MAANTNVGGVSISVSLSVKKALQELDKLDKKMNKTVRSLGGSGGTITADAEKSSSGIAKTVVQLSLLKRIMGGVKGETDGVNKSFRNLSNAALLSRRNPMAALSKGVGGLKSALASLGPAGAAAVVSIGAIAIAAIAAAAAVAGLVSIVVKLGKLGFSSARELETLYLSMEAITGSAEAAKKEVAALQAIAIDSPFLTTTIINLDKFLLSQGVVGGELRGGLINAVLDLAAATGLADDNLGSITYALAQVQARGYLSGDEMRQLANQYVPVMDALRSLPQFANQSTSAIRKMIEQGQISSTTFFEALIESTGKYEGIAARAALTTDGLLNKLEDITRIRLGESFIKVDELTNAISPLGAIRNLLLSIVNMLDQIDWRPFAASLGLLVQTFTGPIGSFFNGGGGDFIVTFFNEWLPNAILTTTKWLRYGGAIMVAFGKVFATVIEFLGDSWNSLWEFLLSFGVSWGQLFQLIAISAAASFIGVVVSISTVISAIGILAGAAQIGVAAMRALFYAMTLNWAGVAEAWNSGVTGAQSVITGLTNVAKALPKAIVASVDAIDDLVNAFRRIGKIELPRLPKLDDGEFFTGEPPGAAGEAGGGGGGGGGGAAKTVDELAKIMDMLFDLTRRWRGMRSELEVGFLGKDGFSATIDQIWEMGKKLDEAFIGLGRIDVADWIFESTQKLVDLAAKRNELAEQLTEATANLAKLVSERDQFAAQIRSSAIKFAAALKVETESVRTFEQVSDRGFFIETEQKKQKDLVKTLRERAKALKDFFNNMQALKDAGLDEDLLKDMLTAGPEQSGEAAAALVAGGQEMVDSVNEVYKDITKTADALAEFGAEEFYDAGITQAQALVDGLTADLEIITTAAGDLTDLIYETVLPFAEEMEEIGKAGGAGLAGGLSGSVPAIDAALGPSGVSGAVGGGFAAIDDELTRGGNVMNDTFTVMGVDMIASIKEWADQSLLDLERWEGNINGFLEDLKFDIGNPFGSWGAKLPSLSDIFSDLDKWIQRLFSGIWKQMRKIPVGAWIIAGLGPVYYAVQAAAGGYNGRSSGGGRRTGGSGSSEPDTDSAGTSSISGYLSGAAGYTAGVLAATSINATASSNGGSGGSGGYFGGSVDGGGTPVIKVYIGDEELRGIVRTEVVYNDAVETTRVLSGRRA